MNELEDSQANLWRAFDYYEGTGDGSHAALAFICAQLHPKRYDDYLEMAQRALRLVPPDSFEAGGIVSRRAMAEVLRNDYEAARQDCTRALEIARHKGDMSLEELALEVASWAAVFNLRWQEGRDLAFQAIRLSGSVGDLSRSIRSRSYAATALLVLGDLDGACQYATEAVLVGERVHHRPRLSDALRTNALVCQAQGDSLAARALLERQLAMEPTDAGALAAEALLEGSMGGYEDARLYLDRVPDRLRHSQRVEAYPSHAAGVSETIALLARTTGNTQYFALAADLAKQAVGSAAVPPLWLLSARVALALVAVQQEDRKGAAGQYQALLPHAGTASPGSGILLDRVLGLLAGTMGELVRAAEHFEQALAFARKGGYRPELAWTCCDYADLLRQRNAPGDAARAAALLDEGLALTQEMGMRPLAERVQARRRA